MQFGPRVVQCIERKSLKIRAAATGYNRFITEYPFPASLEFAPPKTTRVGKVDMGTPRRRSRVSPRIRRRVAVIHKALVLFCLSSGLAVICPDSSVAADAATAADADVSSQIGEVIVTARRREERAQDVPIAITALSGEQIAERHLETGVQLAETVPSMNVSTGTVRNAASYSIRGQGATLGAGPGVVAYFAEVPFAPGKSGIGHARRRPRTVLRPAGHTGSQRPARYALRP